MSGAVVLLWDHADFLQQDISDGAHLSLAANGLPLPNRRGGMSGGTSTGESEQNGGTAGRRPSRRPLSLN